MIELTFNAYSLLISIALIIAVTFGLLLLFSRRQNKKADRYLALVLFIVALWNLSILILDLYLYRFAAGIIWVPVSFTLALGPCYYFYIRFLTDFEFDQNLKIWPHFIPVLFEVFLFLIEVFQGIPQNKGYFQTETYFIFEPIITALAICSFLIYGYLGRKRIQQYHHWVEQNYSNYHRYNLNWLLRLSTLFIILVAFWMGYFLIDFFLFNFQLSFIDYYPFHLFLAVFSIWLSVEAFLNPVIIYSDKVVKSNGNKKLKHEDSAELNDQAKWLKNEIEHHLLYLDPELSLKSLADTLNMHPNYVSKLINEGLNQSFSDCINQYRVDAVLKKLESSSEVNYSMLAIALDCGFNSKTTFNRVFKKFMNKTPIQYKSELNT